ncbi:MAG: type II toxin-antitoxin system RelE family toxin [Candidatus Saccharimonadales bacterium]
MAWQIKFEDKALKELAQTDSTTQRRILRYLHERIARADNPRLLGTPLKGQLAEYWRYRIGSYRVICDIQDAALIVLVIRVAHRSKIYR